MPDYELTNNSYFKWMCMLISEDEHERHKDLSYSELLHKLHSITFEYNIPMDENRATDGENLRYRFGYEESFDDRMVATYLDYRPCSVLEMMVALAARCEDHIMSNDDVGNRTGTWFWTMITSLNLNHMTDANFDEGYVDYVITIFHNRNYELNGEGGLFTVKKQDFNMRNIEIWYQMHLYLNEIDE